MSYYISLESIFDTDSKKHYNIYLKMDWERVLAQGSNLLTRTAAQREKNFPLQSRSYYISLESIFHTDSKKHHNIYSKMDWERVLHQRSNLLTRPAALPKKNFPLQNRSQYISLESIFDRKSNKTVLTF